MSALYTLARAASSIARENVPQRTPLSSQSGAETVIESFDEVCKKHIQSLYDNATRAEAADTLMRWSFAPESPLPRSLDRHFLLFMHKDRFYRLDTDKKQEALDKWLEKTLLEETQTPPTWLLPTSPLLRQQTVRPSGRFRSIRDAIRNKVMDLTKDLQQKGILSLYGDLIDLSIQFRKHWDNRLAIRREISRDKIQEDNFNVFDDEEDLEMNSTSLPPTIATEQAERDLKHAASLVSQAPRQEGVTDEVMAEEAVIEEVNTAQVPPRSVPIQSSIKRKFAHAGSPRGSPRRTGRFKTATPSLLKDERAMRKPRKRPRISKALSSTRRPKTPRVQPNSVSEVAPDSDTSDCIVVVECPESPSSEDDGQPAVPQRFVTPRRVESSSASPFPLQYRALRSTSTISPSAIARYSSPLSSEPRSQTSQRMPSPIQLSTGQFIYPCSMDNGVITNRPAQNPNRPTPTQPPRQAQSSTQLQPGTPPQFHALRTSAETPK